jgi:secreted trypsin-like serine protease
MNMKNEKNIIFNTDYIHVGQWPWMSSFGFFNENNRWKHQCGGTLISSKHFLSAAHCFKNEQEYAE